MKESNFTKRLVTFLLILIALLVLSLFLSEAFKSKEDNSELISILKTEYANSTLLLNSKIDSLGNEIKSLEDNNEKTITYISAIKKEVFDLRAREPVRYTTTYELKTFFDSSYNTKSEIYQPSKLGFSDNIATLIANDVQEKHNFKELVRNQDILINSQDSLINNLTSLNLLQKTSNDLTEEQLNNANKHIKVLGEALDKSTDKYKTYKIVGAAILGTIAGATLKK